MSDTRTFMQFCEGSVIATKIFVIYTIPDSFCSDAKTTPDRLYIYTRNAIFRAIFGTERCCSTPLLQVVHSIHNRFSDGCEPSIVSNTESRECVRVIVG